METLEWLLRGAELGHFAVVAASTHAPKVLEWKKELGSLKPLNRQIFTTYAGYILTMNLLFGLLALIAPGLLLDETPLAAIVCGFIFAYWGVRLVLQFVYYDNSVKPPGLVYTLAEWCFVAMFAYFTAVFGWAMAANIGGLA